MNDFLVITFYSTYHALRLEKIAQEQGLAVTLIPVPRQLSSSCGTAAKTDLALTGQIKALCQEHDIEYHHFFRVPGEAGKKPEMLF